MGTKQGRKPPNGQDVFLAWSVFVAAASLGVAFCLPGEDPLSAAIWAGAASAAAGLLLAIWWAVGYVAPPASGESSKALVAKWEFPFVIGAVVSAVSWFIVAPAWAQGRSPFPGWTCYFGIGAFVAAGIVVDLMRGRDPHKRTLAFAICMVLWTVLMVIGRFGSSTGLEPPLIGVLIGAGAFMYLFKPWRKDEPSKDSNADAPPDPTTPPPDKGEGK